MNTRAWLERYIHGKTQPRYDKPRKSESYRKYTATLLQKCPFDADSMHV